MSRSMLPHSTVDWVAAAFTVATMVSLVCLIAVVPAFMS